MKTTKSTLLLLSLAVLTLGSCKKDEDSVKEDVFSSDLTFKLDGTAKKSTFVVATKDDEDEDVLGLSANLSNSETLTIAFDGLHGTGNYNIATDEAALVYTNGNDPLANIFYAEAGIVKITSISSKEVKGTFELTVKNSGDASKVITEGKFAAKIVE